MRTIAALYQRVSDGTDKSVLEQNRANEDAAGGFGWETVTFSDQVSASRFSKKARPGWTALTAEVASGRISYVVLWEVSRGDRKLATWAAFLDACRETGTGIYVTSRGRLFDLRNGYDRRDLAAEGIDAEFEVEKTSKRVQRGVDGAMEAGTPYGRIPYGYRRSYTREPGRARLMPHQEPDPKEAPVVVEIISRLAAHDSISAIERDFDRRGTRTRAGTKWSHSSIARIPLLGYVYIGKRERNGILSDGTWPALVDADTFWKARRILSDPARRSQALARGGIRPGAAKWLLSYIANCGVCGDPLNTRLMPRAGGKVPVYRCLRGCVSAPVEFLDELATVGVVMFCAKTPVYETLTADADRESQAARDEADSERERLADFEDKAVAGEISAESFARIARKIEQNIARLEARAEELAVPPALRDLVSGASTDQETRWKDILDRWNGMPLAAQREVIRAFFAPVLDAIPRGGNPLDRHRFRMPASERLSGSRQTA